MQDLTEGVLREFVERQCLAYARWANQPSRWLARVRAAKALDNADQHKDRMCDPARHAHLIARQRANYDPAKRKAYYARAGK
jgi:hypothetical protein